MVDITTTTVDQGIPLPFVIPPELRENRTYQPRAEIIYAGTQVIPSKVALDESRWLLTMNIPRNFAYRVIEARFWMSAVGTGVFQNDWKTHLLVTVTSNADNEPAYDIPFNGTLAQGGELTNDLIPTTFSGDNVWSQYMNSLYSFNAPIDASNGSSTLVASWFDQSGDVTVAVTANYRFRLLQYTIEQLKNGQMHAPVPVIGLS